MQHLALQDVRSVVDQCAAQRKKGDLNQVRMTSPSDESRPSLRTITTSYPNTRGFICIALQHDSGDAFAALPAHILTTHVLSSGNLPDPSDLARLRSVSHELRDAVAATGRAVYKLRAMKAIEIGDLNGLQFLQQRGDLGNTCSSVCTFAAMVGQIGVLQWLRKNDFPWDEGTCEQAAIRGHLEVLQWARANGCPWDEFTCSSAAWAGHLDVLKWAHEKDCPWTSFTCETAAKQGHLEVLQWAHENGCLWDEKTCMSAAEGGHFGVLQWLLANGCEWDELKAYESLRKPMN
jgi:hypothetical protein